MLLYQFDIVEEVLVKSSQTGWKIKAKVGDISKLDMSPLTQNDFKNWRKDLSLVVEVHGKAWVSSCVINFFKCT